MDPSLPRSVRLGDPLRRELLDDLRRRVELPRPLAAEWALADADLIVALDDADDLVLAGGTLGGPRRWVLRQPLDDFGEGDLVEVFARELLARGHGAETAHATASRLAARFVVALGAAFSTLARLRPESGALLRNLARPLVGIEPVEPGEPTEPIEPPSPSPVADNVDRGSVSRQPRRDGLPARTSSTRPASPPAARSARPVPRRPARRGAAARTGRVLAGLALAAAVAGVTLVALDSPVPPADPAAPAADEAAGGGPESAALTVVADHAVSLRNADGSPVRLDPCHTYEYEVRPGALPGDVAVAEVGAGFAALEEAGGVAFRFAGFTDNRFPFPVEQDRPPRYPILVSFEHPADSRALVEGADAHLVTPGRPLGGLALAGPTTVRPGLGVLAGGAVVVNETLDPAQRARVLLHELGHVAGLDHATDSAQIMATPVPETGPLAYRDGDRAGLAELRAEGCVLSDAERDTVFSSGRANPGSS